jgi:3',5'-nucleoside bisphosphate phosphatase
LSIVCISDHDNLAAYFEIREYAESCGILLIPGTELSSEFNDIDVHLLAYAFDPLNEAMTKALVNFREGRRTRGERMVEKLQSIGLAISIERVREIQGEGAFGRPHVARALVETGAVATIDEAFRKYLGPGLPGWVSKPRFEVEEVVKLVHAAGGVVSIAHPTLYPEHIRIVPELLELGVDAIEILHPKVDDAHRRHYSALAKEKGKFITGGSDDHGFDSRCTIGSIRVPEESIRPIVDRMQ